jgi:predicted small metal-binding protein
MARKFVDCRSMPSESNCSLYISGEEEHVIQAAAEHAASVHGHEDNQELREMIKSQLQDEKAEVGVAAA